MVGALIIRTERSGGYAYRPIPGTAFESYRVGDIRTLSFDANTSHRAHKRIFSLDDLDGSTADVTVGGDVQWDYFAGEKQYSQEINLISPTAGRFDWILGACYQRMDCYRPC